MRSINQGFINDLLQGELAFFLEQVKTNRKLSLEIRNGYINIYYRGGSLLKIEQKNEYRFSFDSKYCLNKNNDTNYEAISSLNVKDIDAYKGIFNILIAEIDSWLAVNPKPEREFQHNLLISNDFIIDIEYQVKKKYRLDMIMYIDNKIIIVENKFGGGAISGNAGIAKHYKDICDILSDTQLKEELIKSIVSIIRAKRNLELLNIEINEEDIKDIEILFIFADYNKNSNTIKNEIKMMSKEIPAKILFMDKDKYHINYTKVQDLWRMDN